MSNAKPQTNFRLDPKIVKRLDHWCIDNDIKNRSEGVEQLLTLALDSLGHVYPKVSE
jgi:metal-responsive CopG/Arc/MetJ family transcriptional regulator